jgi:hypothetical protein
MRLRKVILAVTALMLVSLGALASWAEFGQRTPAKSSLPSTTVVIQNEELTGASARSSSSYLPGAFDPTRSDLTISELSDFSDFPVYTAGRQIGPYLLTAILREHRKIEEPVGFDPVIVDSLSLVYGDCVPSSDAGCAPPLVIQIWPDCQRPLARARARTDTGGVVLKRGVPTVELGDRTEMATGNETIVVFGEPELRAQAINQLRPANGAARESSKANDTVTLPAPVRGVLEPGAACT